MKDKAIQKILKEEEMRQKKNVTLIASENYCSKDVLEAMASTIINKYSEGYIGKRYYKGQVNSDKIEELCKERALKLFKLNKKSWDVNVQPYSGSPANLAVYLALVPIGYTIMGMSMASGGHLTHGQKVSITGKVWRQVSYDVDINTEIIDYEKVREIAIREKPNIIVAGFTAYPRAIDWARFRAIADEVGAYLHVDMSHIAGLVAGNAYKSPFPYADTVMTTTHKTLRGPRSAMIFSKIDDRDISSKINKAVFPGLQGGPHMNQIAAVAVALNEALNPKFKIYAKQVVKNAKALAKELQKLGWRIVSGGTDTHLILVDTYLDGNGITGEHASNVLEAAGIVVNKNGIPGDKLSPFVTSGLRLGTAAETTRGWIESDFIKLAQKIDKILKANLKKK